MSGGLRGASSDNAEPLPRVVEVEDADDEVDQLIHSEQLAAQVEDQIRDAQANNQAVLQRIQELERLTQERRELDALLKRRLREHSERQIRSSPEQEGDDHVYIDGEPAAKRPRTNPTGSTTTPTVPTGSTATATHPAPHAYATRPKMRELEVYEGKTITEAQVFIGRAERQFRTDKGYYFPTDQAKIDHCVEAFNQKLFQKWSSYEFDHFGLNITWEQFKDFILEAIMDKDNRRLDTVAKHERATQREDESVDDFVIYLDALERELDVKDESYRWQTLYGKLREDIRARISFYAEIPQTRQGLISLARRVENAERLVSHNKNGNKTRNDGGSKGNGRGVSNSNSNSKDNKRDPPRSASPRGDRKSNDYRNRGNHQDGRKGLSDANKTPTGGNSDEPQECWRCHKAGHLSRNCPEVTCYHCQKKGHTVPNCPEKNKDSGKDQARS